MAFPYYPAYQPQMYQNQYMPQTQQQNGLIWVQGIEAAKSYPVSAGQSVLLMDSESNAFFIKTADASGMPLPLRVFDYTERTANNAPKTAQETRTEPSIDLSAYVTRDELENRIAQIRADYEHKDNRNQNQQKGGQNNGK
jgi:hypothetical protein